MPFSFSSLLIKSLKTSTKEDIEAPIPKEPLSILMQGQNPDKRSPYVGQYVVDSVREVMPDIEEKYEELYSSLSEEEREELRNN